MHSIRRVLLTLGPVLALAGGLVACAPPATTGMHMASLAIPEQTLPPNGTHLTAFSPGLVPPGFMPACQRYDWLCAAPMAGGDGIADAELMARAARVNTAVNRAIIPVEDRANYGRADEWRVPENGRGDCEDYALYKMKLLIEEGVDPGRLLIALVLDREGVSHAVLILRLERGDVVLDNMVQTIKPWQRTGYTFLKKQDASERSRWQVVLLGPRASRSMAGL